MSLWKGQAFNVSHADGTGTSKGGFEGGLRAFFEYRDLGIKDATKGKFVAHVIRASFLLRFMMYSAEGEQTRSPHHWSWRYVCLWDERCLSSWWWICDRAGGQEHQGDAHHLVRIIGRSRVYYLYSILAKRNSEVMLNVLTPTARRRRKKGLQLHNQCDEKAFASHRLII